jgi:PLD-like domain
LATLLTANIWKQITAAALNSQKPARVAVAYVGSHAPTLLPLSKGSVLVADVSINAIASGSTSPSALEQIRSRGVDIYSFQYLHAKAFAFDNIAFVGSTNVSRNSAATLLEASLKTAARKDIHAVRAFVESLCVTRLSQVDLNQLAGFYKPPRKGSPFVGQQRSFTSLLMELTLEQGVDRATQVQPPKSVWDKFFGVSHPTNTLPTLTLINERTNVPEVRPVVKHHHTYTIEISDADMPRPAIIQFRPAGTNKYTYLVHRPGDPKFFTVRNFLSTLYNPFWTSGRRWVLI